MQGVLLSLTTTPEAVLNAIEHNLNLISGKVSLFPCPVALTREYAQSEEEEKKLALAALTLVPKAESKGDSKSGGAPELRQIGSSIA